VPVDGAFVAALQDAARQRHVSIVVGVIVPGRETGAESRSANVALAIGPDGVVLGAYAKVHLFDAFGTRESDALVAGDPAAAPLVFDVDGLRFGVQTCYDLRFPESSRRLADAGAQVVIAIAAWASGPGKVDQLGVLARARAIENTAYLMLASQHGTGRSGHSAVVDPLGAVLAEAGDRAALLTVDLDAARVAEVRARVPVLEHRRYDVVPRP
jgi:predicted amidohydrolase